MWARYRPTAGTSLCCVCSSRSAPQPQPATIAFAHRRDRRTSAMRAAVNRIRPRAALRHASALSIPQLHRLGETGRGSSPWPRLRPPRRSGRRQELTTAPKGVYSIDAKASVIRREQSTPKTCDHNVAGATSRRLSIACQLHLYGSEGETRTLNLAVNSRLLCQLSYLGMVGP